MTQEQIEQLTQEEYCHQLSYGDPISAECEGMYTIVDTINSVLMDTDTIDHDSQETTWISTLDSTTFPSMTFGYFDAPYVSTLV